MKVSIDSILGSARRINDQRKLDEDSVGKKRKDVASDSVKIEKRVNSRLDSIQKDLRDLQSSLTRNQIIHQGIKQLQEDFSTGSRNRQGIMGDFTFENKNVLHSFVGDNISSDILKSRLETVNNLIRDDVSGLKKLHVEVENILASNISKSEKVGTILDRIGTLLGDRNISSLNSMSQLNAETVMRLIK